MPPTLTGKPQLVNFRPTDDDWKLLKKLQKTLGVGASQIIRIALRKLEGTNRG